MEEQQKRKSPILAIWRKLQSGEIRLEERVKRKIREQFQKVKSGKPAQADQ